MLIPLRLEPIFNYLVSIFNSMLSLLPFTHESRKSKTNIVNLLILLYSFNHRSRANLFAWHPILQICNPFLQLNQNKFNKITSKSLSNSEKLPTLPRESFRVALQFKILKNTKLSSNSFFLYNQKFKNSKTHKI